MLLVLRACGSGGNPACGGGAWRAGGGGTRGGGARVEGLDVTSPLMLVAVTIALAVIVAPIPAAAQQAPKVWRIGLLDMGRASALESHPYHKPFMQGLQEHGYISGKNIMIEYRGAEGRQERLPELAIELVRLGVDILVAAGTLSTLAAQHATTTIPIVMVAVGDPVGTGFAATLAHPGGNITGLSDVNPDLSAKRLELLKEVIPKLVRAAVLLNPAHPPNVRQLEETRAAARTFGVALQTLEVRGSDDLERAVGAAARARAGAVIILPDAFTVSRGDQIAELAARHRLPTMFSARAQVVAGGLMAYGASLPALFRRATTYIDKLLKGAKAGDLPIEQPTQFELVINLKTAKALDLTIPQSVLLRADEVIQ
jgi:putative ABC transport system substrate-binding protein